MLLIDHGDLRPTYLAEHLGTELEQITTFEKNTSSHDTAMGTKIAHNGQRYGRLATTRLSDQANTLSLLQGQRDVDDGRDVTFAGAV